MDATLYTDNSEESFLAEKHVKKFIPKCKIIPIDKKMRVYYENIILPSCTCLFSLGEERNLLPSIVIFGSERGLLRELYLHLEGTRNVVRENILKDSSFSKIWREIKTSYQSREYKDGKFGDRQKLVTCFDENKKIIYEGSIDKSPYTFQHELDKKPFKDWYDVGCWKIGKLEEIARQKSKEGFIIDKSKNLLLFLDEIDLLKEGKQIPLASSSCAYQVLFIADFLKDGNLYQFYANMID